jgi:hypothetical protein
MVMSRRYWSSACRRARVDLGRTRRWSSAGVHRDDPWSVDVEVTSADSLRAVTFVFAVHATRREELEVDFGFMRSRRKHRAAGKLNRRVTPMQIMIHELE